MINNRGNAEIALPLLFNIKTKTYLKNSKSRPRARRELTKKRSIHRVCEHFKKVHNAAIGR
jgi:hypothetical protein